MKVLRLCWLGVPTREYVATVALFRDVMSLKVEFEEPATTELSFPARDRGPRVRTNAPYFEFRGQDGNHRDLASRREEAIRSCGLGGFGCIALVVGHRPRTGSSLAEGREHGLEQCRPGGHLGTR